MPQNDEKVIKQAAATECGKRLAAARNAHGHRQIDLARLTGWSEDHPRRGLSPSRIANYEQGTRQIGHYEAELFSRAYAEYHKGYFIGVIAEHEAKVLRLIEQNIDNPPPSTPSRARRAG